MSDGRRLRRNRKSTRKVQVSSVDMRWLHWLGRHRLASVTQMMRRFECSEPTVRKRMQRMKDKGLVASVKLLYNAPGAYFVTGGALDLVQLDAKPYRFSSKTYLHTIALTDLAINYELAGDEVTSEVEIRAHEWADGLTADQLRWCAPNPGGSPHPPDLHVLRRQGDADSARELSLAIELELSHKTIKDWTAILTAWRNATNIDGVIYYTPLKGIADSLARIATEDVGLPVAGPDAPPPPVGYQGPRLKIVRYQPRDEAVQLAMPGHLYDTEYVDHPYEGQRAYA